MWLTKKSTNAINESMRPTKEWQQKQQRDSSSTSCICAQGRGTRQHKFLLNYEHFICSLSLALMLFILTKRLSVRVCICVTFMPGIVRHFRYVDLYFLSWSLHVRARERERSLIVMRGEVVQEANAFNRHESRDLCERQSNIKERRKKKQKIIQDFNHNVVLIFSVQPCWYFFRIVLNSHLFCSFFAFLFENGKYEDLWISVCVHVCCAWIHFYMRTLWWRCFRHENNRTKCQWKLPGKQHKPTKR